MYACADIHHAQLLHALLVSDINYQSSSILKQMRMALFSNYVPYFAEGEGECSLEEVLIFCAGASRVPPLGFDCQPKISFQESSLCKRLPTASTCAIELRLYTHNTCQLLLI